MRTPTFVHARAFDTRWGLGLVFPDIPDDRDSEVLQMYLYASVHGDGWLGRVAIKSGLPVTASPEAHEAANREALRDMTAEKFEAVFEKAGLGKMLDSRPDASE